MGIQPVMRERGSQGWNMTVMGISGSDSLSQRLNGTIHLEFAHIAATVEDLAM
jgi:hypothetical protein